MTDRSATERTGRGERTVCLDEMTGIQVQRRKFAYIRHGTQTLIASFDVARGRIMHRHSKLYSLPN